MRHKVCGKKLGRKTSHRRSLLMNLASSLILHEQIFTTLAKAKTVRPYLEKLVTKAKLDKLHNKRHIASILSNKHTHQKLFDLGKRYSSRNGGYLRIVKAGYRHGDNAPMAYIQFVQES
ncbi:MAG: 50S ribosomal protein L17 [Rickettsiaceae bacterium]